MRERADGIDAIVAASPGESPRTTRRGPLGENDVLEEMHGEKEMHAERVDRRHADREDHCHRTEEADNSPARCREPAEGEQVGGSQAEHDDRLRVHDHAYGSTALR